MSPSAKSRSEKAVAPAILTFIALGLAVGLAMAFPLAMVGLYIGILPVVLIIVWAGYDVEAPIDRILRVDAEHALAIAHQAAR